MGYNRLIMSFYKNPFDIKLMSSLVPGASHEVSNSEESSHVIGGSSNI